MTAGNGNGRVLDLVGGEPQRAAVERACAERGFGLAAHSDAEALLASSRPARHVILCLPKAGVSAAAPQIAGLLDAGIETVVVLCAAVRAWEVRAILEAGASGVVLSEEIEGTLGACLEATLSGQVCIPRAHASQAEPPALSAREKQVLGLVVMGHTNSEIATLLFLAESTVKSHLSSAFAKLGVHSRNEAVELILDSERGLGAGILGLSVEQVA